MITFRVEAINPALAAQYLSNNTGNRPLRHSLVKRIAQDMREGAWALNGESIIFSESGRLLDGQNRLSAVIESGMTVAMAVTRGVEHEDDAFKTIDSGASRSLGDWIAGEGHRNWHRVAAALRVLSDYGEGLAAVGSGQVGTLSASKSHMIVLYGLHPSLPTAIKADVRVPGMHPSISDVIRYALSCNPVYADKAEVFFTELAKGESITKENPVYQLRGVLISSMQSTRKLKKAVVFQLTVKAWNAYAQGRSIRSLYWRAQEGALTLVGYPQESVWGDQLATVENIGYPPRLGYKKVGVTGF